jgi:hypothetical protein
MMSEKISQENIHLSKNYQKFIKQKQKIKEKYDDGKLFSQNSVGRGSNKERLCRYYTHEGGRELWLQYQKEIGDLIFEQDGAFQKLTWELESQDTRKKRDYIVRGPKQRDVWNIK